MARETVIDYETVEIEEEVVYCDTCSAVCTQDHAYIMKEVCNSCADEWNRSGGFVSGSKEYITKKIESLNNAKDRTKAFSLIDGMEDAILLPLFIPMFLPMFIMDGEFDDFIFYVLNYIVGFSIIAIFISMLMLVGIL